MRTILFVLLLVSTIAVPARAQEDLPKRVADLEKRVAELEKLLEPLKREMVVRKRREKMQVLARRRMKEDQKVFNQAQLDSIEQIYQVANRKWNTVEAMDSLTKLMKEFPKANRTGCGVLYLAQMSKDDIEKEFLLKKAIKSFNDCWYGDGVQVGPYARLLLAHHYARKNKAEAAAKLAAELKTNYPEAIDHQGRLLIELLPKAEAQ